MPKPKEHKPNKRSKKGGINPEPIVPSPPPGPRAPGSRRPLVSSLSRNTPITPSYAPTSSSSIPILPPVQSRNSMPPPYAYASQLPPVKYGDQTYVPKVGTALGRNLDTGNEVQQRVSAFPPIRGGGKRKNLRKKKTQNPPVTGFIQKIWTSLKSMIA